MKVENVDGEWIIRVPETVVRALKLEEGFPVTIRPLYRDDPLRVAMAEARGRLPEYSFDRVDWDGKAVAQLNGHAVDLSPIAGRVGPAGSA